MSTESKDIRKCKLIKILKYQEIDIEKFIHELEVSYQVELNRIPNYELQLRKLFRVQTIKDMSIQQALLRRREIVAKLLQEFYRASPFELTDKLARTRNKWRQLEKNTKPKSVPLINYSLGCNAVPADIFNSKIQSSSCVTAGSSPDLDGIQASEASISQTSISEESIYGINEVPELKIYPHIPRYTSKNPRKLLKYVDIPDIPTQEQSLKQDVARVYNKSITKCVKTHINCVASVPAKIKLLAHAKGTFSFDVVNLTCKIIFLKVVGLEDKEFFMRYSIHPKRNVKLYAYMTVSFTLNYELKSCIESSTAILFHVNEDYLNPAIKCSIFQIPVSSVQNHENLEFTKAVNIPPEYIWKLDESLDKLNPGYFSIRSQTSCAYHVHIRDDLEDIIEDVPGVESSEIEQILPSVSKTNIQHPVKHTVMPSIHCAKWILTQLLIEIFDDFYFSSRYIYLPDSKKVSIPIYFKKAHHHGEHYKKYKVQVFKAITGEKIRSSPFLVTGETRPHPLKIRPELLDMTQIPPQNGYYRSFFYLKNNLESLPIRVKVVLPDKLQKLIQVEPLDVVLPIRTEVKIKIELCAPICMNPEDDPYLLYVILKLDLISTKKIYFQSPPLYYEVILPGCQTLLSSFNVADTEELKIL